MTESVSVSSGIASRYAAALFELVLEENLIDELFSDIVSVREVLAAGGGFDSLIASPIYSRQEMAAAVEAVAARIGLGRLMRNTLALMASKRRLFVLPAMLDRLETMLDEHRGVVTAEIAAARELNESESAALKTALRGACGKDVRFEIRVDESLIGGVSARLGSRLVDATVKAKLANLKNALREVE